MRAAVRNVARLPLSLCWAIRAAYLRRLIASAEADRAALIRDLQRIPAQLRVHAAAIGERRTQLIDAERAMRGH